jgi:hypothetical protein
MTIVAARRPAPQKSARQGGAAAFFGGTSIAILLVTQLNHLMKEKS